MTKPLTEIRLFFEPKPGTQINHNEMFEHYASNWLDGFDARYGGFIIMDALKKVTEAFEPVYQYIFDNPSHSTKDYLEEYIERNTLHGYYVHMYTKYTNENSQQFRVFGE